MFRGEEKGKLWANNKILQTIFSLQLPARFKFCLKSENYPQCLNIHVNLVKSLESVFSGKNLLIGCQSTILISDWLSQYNTNLWLVVRCSRCCLVYYCDAQCQRKHWKKHKSLVDIFILINIQQFPLNIEYFNNIQLKNSFTLKGGKWNTNSQG